MAIPETDVAKPGESVFLEDVGGAPGMPKVDGSALLNLPGSSADTPGVNAFGGILFYSVAGGGTAGVIQYTRVKLAAGKTYDRGIAFIDAGGVLTPSLRIALYSQANPLDAAQGVKPNARVAITDELVLGGGDDGTYVTPALTDGLDLGNPVPYVVPVTGYYWVALVPSSAALKFAVTAATYRAGLLPLWKESSTGVVLPLTPSGLTAPADSPAYVGIVEQGVLL